MPCVSIEAWGFSLWLIALGVGVAFLYVVLVKVQNNEEAKKLYKLLAMGMGRD